MPAGGLVVAGLGAAISAGTAIYANAQKQKELKQQQALLNNRPVYPIPPEQARMQALAEAQAGQGLSGAASQQLKNNADNALSTETNAIQMGGGNNNQVANIAANSQNAYNNIALYDNNTRLQNLSNLQNIWANASAEKDKAWSINQEQPWKDNMAAVYGQLQGATNLQNSSLNSLGSAFIGSKGNFLANNSNANPLKSNSGGYNPDFNPQVTTGGTPSLSGASGFLDFGSGG